MEKRVAHYKLSIVKNLIAAHRVKATMTAFNGAADLGIKDLQGMCEVVLSLGSSNFHKSMTTHANHKIWQDVYYAKTPQNLDVYLKLTVIDDVLIVSFKEL